MATLLTTQGERLVDKTFVSIMKQKNKKENSFPCMLCVQNSLIVRRGKGLIKGWVQREEHSETTSKL